MKSISSKEQKIINSLKDSAMAMSGKQMRLSVIDDVLEQLRNKKLKVRRGHYIQSINLDKIIIDAHAYGQVQPYVDVIQNNCHVCALGACLLSYVKKFNDTVFRELGMVNTGDCYIRSRIVNKLESIFENRQLNLIESAFECRDICELYDEYAEYAVEFGKNYDDDDDRLEAIMLNMKANGGEFKP